MKPAFSNKTEEIQSLRKAKYSYYQIAKYLDTTTKTVHEHIKKPDVSRDLSQDETDYYIEEIGYPNGFKSGEERPRRTTIDETK